MEDGAKGSRVDRGKARLERDKRVWGGNLWGCMQGEGWPGLGDCLGYWRWALPESNGNESLCRKKTGGWVYPRRDSGGSAAKGGCLGSSPASAPRVFEMVVSAVPEEPDAVVLGGLRER